MIGAQVPSGVVGGGKVRADHSKSGILYGPSVKFFAGKIKKYCQVNKKGSSEKFCTRCGILLRFVESDPTEGNWSRSCFKSKYHTCRKCDNRRDASGTSAAVRIGRALIRARKRAKTRGLAGNARPTDLRPFPVTCPLLGIPLYYGGGKEFRPDRATIDRKDSAKGYEPGNVWIISARANTLKNDATLDELKRLVANWELSV